MHPTQRQLITDFDLALADLQRAAYQEGFVGILDSSNTLTPEYLRTLESRVDHIKTLITAAITVRLYPPSRYEVPDEPKLTGSEATGVASCSTGS